MEIDNRCFRCGDKVEGPKIIMGGFVKGDTYAIVFHFDCWAMITRQIVEEHKRWLMVVMESDKRPEG